MKYEIKSKADKRAQALLKVISELLTEIHPHHLPSESISLDSRFEEELGLDSLSRVELIARVEKEFKLSLPERSYSEAETPRDLLRMLLGAQEAYAILQDSGIASITLDETEGTPFEAQTLVDVLNWHVAQHPDRPHIKFYQDDGQGDVITYAQLEKGAKNTAILLQQHRLEPGQPIAIMLPSSPDYFFIFFGILMAGGIPVPIYPPARPSQLEDHIRRHARILDNCRASILITVPEAKHVAKLLKSLVPNLQHIISTTDLKDSSSSTMLPSIHEQDIAFIQYTSGSTGNPKGVVLTHANLLNNIRAMGKVVKAGPKDVFVSWLPLYHDMGLIGAWLGSLYYAAFFVVMSPLDFLARPERWLWAIHRYRGTLSASPNFGYEYSMHRIKDTDLTGLDLSSWRAAFNGAEAVSPETVEEFNKRFAPFGFNKDAMMPVYGLAESSVGLAFPPLGRGVHIDHIDRTTFTRTGSALNTVQDDSNVLKFVSCGLPLPGHQLRIVDDTGHELPERQEGRLEFRGPSSTSGYYRDVQKTQTLFDGEWLDTGDLAYIADGELYVTGRIKDIIIRAGRNIYPDELEKMVGDIPNIRKGCVAVFASMDPKRQTEKLVILAETRSEDPNEHQRLRNDINTLSIDLTGIPPDEVVFAPPGSVLKTSSGKIRRSASRERYEKGMITKKPQNVVWQVVRLALSGIKPQLRRIKHYIGSLFFALYSCSVFALVTPVAWLSMILLPKFSMRWSMLQVCTKFLAYATATPLRVNGVENLPPAGTSCVLVANHASLLDGAALIAALPRHFRFIAKSEFTKDFYTRLPLEKIHTEFVERFETTKSVQDTEHLRTVLESGHALFFFPEGTFSRVPGLMPFRLGAFSIAAGANVPVIPISIRGTRSILRDTSWFPHHSPVHIEIGKPIDPEKIRSKAEVKEWDVAIELRDQSREFILRHCGEPDLS
ncbi:AMP-binding protein [Sulfurovum sp. AR]|uniref:AMP-binding protein n=1 Tax=Sulfurovum sp. AR TaxID=1165841 RepID=UPI00025C4CA7|nr:AMP-binding protein [Sulfurovum sp. AR]EIF51343.1 acyltransferase [Sulfurovum sp. AR]